MGAIPAGIAAMPALVPPGVGRWPLWGAVGSGAALGSLPDPFTQPGVCDTPPQGEGHWAEGRTHPWAVSGDRCGVAEVGVELCVYTWSTVPGTGCSR